MKAVPVRPPAARPAWQRYIMALLTVALATLARLWLQACTEQTVLIFYFGAVIFTAWYGGLGPGILATVLNLLSNAVKHTAPGGRVVVRCEARPFT
ncbi:MAG: DUF4118 domain-containing protein [Longimicrobiales bacterium]